MLSLAEQSSASNITDMAGDKFSPHPRASWQRQQTAASTLEWPTMDGCHSVEWLPTYAKWRKLQLATYI